MKIILCRRVKGESIVTRKMATQAAAALLDELMGRTRNVLPQERQNKLSWDSPEVRGCGKEEYIRYYEEGEGIAGGSGRRQRPIDLVVVLLMSFWPVFPKQDAKHVLVWARYMYWPGMRCSQVGLSGTKGVSPHLT